uniref:F-box/LRR-repeat protein 15 n=1 Tax=Macrostomum lignano TaxID=282301 RepID=A0A1I8HGM4_9PLAT
LLLRMPRLADLTVRELRFTDKLAGQLVAAAERSGGFESLDFRSCQQLTERGLAALLSACPSLRRLRLSDCRALGGVGYRLAAARLPPGLEQLRLTGWAWPGLVEADLALPLPRGLRELELLLNQQGSPAGLCGLGLRAGLAGCQELTKLTLDLCHSDLLPALLTQLPRLRCLRLTDCRRLTRQAWGLTASSPDLHELMLLQWSSLTDEAVADLCASPVARGLRRLCLSPCFQLTRASLASIASSCPWLTRLTLNGCRRISQADLQLAQPAFEQRVELIIGREAEAAAQKLQFLSDTELD